MSTPIWDREEITSTVAQYKDTEYADSLEAFDKRIIQAVQKGHSPAVIARYTFEDHPPSFTDVAFAIMHPSCCSDGWGLCMAVRCCWFSQRENPFQYMHRVRVGQAL